MAGMIYSMCALTAFVCAWLLLRAWYRSRYRFLLWSGICFSALTLNNILLVADKLFVPYTDLSTPRLVTALVAMLIMLYGLIWDAE
jgi:hypothetical protein